MEAGDGEGGRSAPASVTQLRAFIADDHSGVRAVGAVEQRLLGDTEWWGCPVEVNMKCMRGARGECGQMRRGAGVASLRSKGMHNPP